MVINLILSIYARKRDADWLIFKKIIKLIIYVRTVLDGYE